MPSTADKSSPANQGPLVPYKISTPRRYANPTGAYNPLLPRLQLVHSRPPYGNAMAHMVKGTISRSTIHRYDSASTVKQYEPSTRIVCAKEPKTGAESSLSCETDLDALSRSQSTINEGEIDDERKIYAEQKQSIERLRAERQQIKQQTAQLLEKLEERKREAAGGLAEKKSLLQEEQRKLREEIDLLQLERKKRIESKENQVTFDLAMQNNQLYSQELDGLQQEYETSIAAWKTKVEKKQLQLQSVRNEIEDFKSTAEQSDYSTHLQKLTKIVSEKLVEESKLKHTKSKLDAKFEETAAALDLVKKEQLEMDQRNAEMLSLEGEQFSVAEVMTKLDKLIKSIDNEEAYIRYDEQFVQDAERDIKSQEERIEATKLAIRKLHIAAEQTKVKNENEPAVVNLGQKIRDAKSELNKAERSLDSAIRTRPVSSLIRREQIERSALSYACTQNFQFQMEELLLRQVGAEIVRDLKS